MDTRADMEIAVAQFAPTGDGGTNLSTIAAMTGDAAARGARLVVFPEYSSVFIDPFDETLIDHAQSLDGPFTQGLTEIADGEDVTIVAGMLEAAGDGRRVRNTLVAVDGGGVRATARKLHLYDAFGQRESDWMEPAPIAEPDLFEVDGVRVGMQTCYDLRFPEVTRRLVDAGADLVLVPAQWVRGALKEHHWMTLAQARAIENTVYLAGADHPPPQGVGASIIVDPEGVVIASAGTATRVAVAPVDPALLARVRRINPALAQRRFSISRRR